jgi:hypothetical protein
MHINGPCGMCENHHSTGFPLGIFLGVFTQKLCVQMCLVSYFSSVVLFPSNIFYFVCCNLIISKEMHKVLKYLGVGYSDISTWH